MPPIKKTAKSSLAGTIRASKKQSNASRSIPHLIIEARAGTGKTTTLIEGLKKLKGVPSDHPASRNPSPQQSAIWDALLLSQSTAKTVAFVAFNTSIADELARRVPQGCEAKTSHKLGRAAVANAFGNESCRLNADRTQDILSELLGMDIWELRRKMSIFTKALCELVDLCKQNLSEVDDESLDNLCAHYDVELDRYKSEVYQWLPKVLERSLDITKDRCISFSDMIWLPIALNLPVPQYDLLLVDEAQDLNRCQQALVRKAGKRLVLCGDPCQPPGTMISIAGTDRKVPIESLKKGQVIVGYSPREGRNRNNRVVNGISVTSFRGDLVEVEAGGLITRYTPQHHCYASFGPLRDSFVVYMMRRGDQYRIGSCQLNYGASGNGIVHRLRTEGGDDAWILEVHATKREARLREMELSHKYRLPQVVFLNKNQAYILDDEGVIRFWEYVGNSTTKGGLQAIADYGLQLSRPIAVAGEQWQQSFKRPAIFAASNLQNGMIVRTENGEWVPIKVRRVPYEGPVYSLSVSHEELYIADGIVTHNCQAIYGFAGADAESMPRMFEQLNETPQGCLLLPLNYTRRCGKAIVREANAIVPDFYAFDDAHEGKVSQSIMGNKTEARNYRDDVSDGDMILCRVNAPLVSQCFKFLKAGRKANIQGRDVGAGLIKTVKMLEKRANLNPYAIANLVSDLDKWRSEEEAKELNKKHPSEARILAINDRHDCLQCFAEDARTVADVISKIESIFSDSNQGGIRLSSVHKSKGLEADRVFLLEPEGSGIPHPMAKSKWQIEQEWNLRYVAITRAIQELVYVS